MFLYAERPNSPMHIGPVMIYDPSTAPNGFVRFKDILRTFEQRLHRSSVFTRKLLNVPLGLDHPYWVEDEDFDLDLGETVDLDYVVMRLYLENDFPVDLDVQIYYLDDMGAVIDSLFSPRDLLISSPPVDNDGRTIGFTTSIHDVNYSKSRIEAIEQAKQIRIDASINTTKDGQTQPTVSFYEDYGLRVQLGVAAKVLIKTEGE